MTTTESTSAAVQLLRELRGLRVELRADGDSLRYDAPAGAMTSALLARVKEHKQQVISVLRGAESVQRVTYYLRMRDGVRLLADVFRPRREGRLVAEPLPAIWCHERYGVADADDGESRLDTSPWLRELLGHGYVVVSVHARGTGGSTGDRFGEFTEAETLDSYDVTEWLAAQPFCDGNVGMFGDSYLGIAQLLATAAAPPHLKAIFPGVALNDLYAFLYPGGVYRHDFAGRWSDMVRMLDSSRPADEGIFARTERLSFRDSADADGVLLYVAQSPATLTEAISRSGIPIRHLSGWYDLWVRDVLTWYTTLGTTQHVLIGPWCHNDRTGVDLATEHLRWFDRWLKDVPNGVDEEPPIRYYTIGALPGTEWRSAHEWPLPQAVATAFYFVPGEPGASALERGLDRQRPAVAAVDEYTVDYAATSGRRSRWANGYLTYAFGADRFGYDLMDNDRRSLTYTSEPLDEALEVTGHPMVSLQIDSTHRDGDFFVYLQDIDENGRGTYVSEGVLRASHRAVDTSAAAPLGLPVHPHTTASVQPLPEPAGQPSELLFDLHPTSVVFARGHRIRVSVACCDADNARTPVHDPPPTIRVHRGGAAASWISLPVVPAAPRQEHTA